MTNTEWSYDKLENYIREDKYSICREERQYVVYLRDILKAGAEIFENVSEAKSLSDNVFKALGIYGKEIDNVFYEPAFMRDCFDRERRQVYFEASNSKEADGDLKIDEDIFLNKNYGKPVDIIMKSYNDKDRFNIRLLDYVCKYLKDDELKGKYIKHVDITDKINYVIDDIKKHMSLCMCEQESNGLCLLDMNFGGKAAKSFWNSHIDKLSEKNNEELYRSLGGLICFIMSKMMKAQADLAIIYSDDDAKYIHFIECKFESEEDTYVYRTLNKDIEYNISQVGLQNIIVDYLSKQVFVSDEKLLGRVGKVIFAREEKENAITIASLAKLSNYIFSSVAK